MGKIDLKKLLSIFKKLSPLLFFTSSITCGKPPYVQKEADQSSLAATALFSNGVRATPGPWSTTLGEGYYTRSMSDHNGNFIVGIYSYSAIPFTLTKLDAADGKVLWQVPTDISPKSIQTDRAGNTFLRSGDRLLLIDTNGKRKWSTSLGYGKNLFYHKTNDQMIVDGINNNYPPYGELHVYNQDGHVRLLADYAKTVFLAENGNETIAMRDTLIARYSADGNRLSSINFIPPSPEYRMQEWVIGKDGSPFRLYEILPSSPEGICSYSVEKYDATNGKKIWSFERDVARSCSHSEVEVINDDEIMMMRRAQGDYLSAYTSGQEVYFGHHHAYKATQSGVLVSEYGSGSSSSISKLDWAGKSLWSKPITRHFDEALYFLGNEELVVNEADIVLSLSILLNRPDHWDGPVLVERYE